MPFLIVRENIVHMRTDAIVNAANNRLKAGGGVCGAIFDKAGRARLQAACDAIGHCDTGRAVITEGFDLPAKYIIHTAGPVWVDGRHGEEALLRGCYAEALKLAIGHGCESIAFPLIASGVYGYPKDQALSVAVSEIGGFLLEHEMMVYLVVYDRHAYRLSARRFADIQSYIDDHYVDERLAFESLRGRTMADTVSAPMSRSLKSAIRHREDSFSQAVLRRIDLRGEKDAAVYKRANLDRKLFHKLRTDVRYQPSRATALALAIALCLNLDETRDLLARAGYALSPSSRSDIVVSYFIRCGNYNIHEINEALFAFDEPCIGGGQ